MLGARCELGALPGKGPKGVNDTACREAARATPPRHTKAGSATCSPAGTALCSAFETDCGVVGGGMSSSPDGGVTCSVAKSKARGLAARHVHKVLRLRAHPTAAQSEVATCHSDGSDERRSPISIYEHTAFFVPNRKLEACCDGTGTNQHGSLPQGPSNLPRALLAARVCLSAF